MNIINIIREEIESVADKIYKDELDKNIETFNVSKQFPNYNDPNSNDHKNAVKSINTKISQGKNIDDKTKIELQNKISAGLS